MIQKLRSKQSMAIIVMVGMALLVAFGLMSSSNSVGALANTTNVDEDIQTSLAVNYVEGLEDEEISMDDISGEIREDFSKLLPEGFEGESMFVTVNDIIGRSLDGGEWEYSTDGGKTWTKEAPDGFSSDDVSITFEEVLATEGTN